MPAISLTDLQEQIAQREQELQALREQLQARQSHLDELNQRKEKLQSELRQVEEEIAALATTKARATEQAASAAPAVPPSPASATRTEGQLRLGELLVSLLREASEAMTARPALRRGAAAWLPVGQSESSQGHREPPPGLEEPRHRAACQGPVRLPPGLFRQRCQKAQEHNQSTRPTKSQKTPAKPGKSAPAAKKSSGKPSSSVEPGQHEVQPSLRQVLTDVLTNSRKPLSTRELTDQILATGYHSTSKNFLNVVSVQLSKMPNVERLPDKGYRLKMK